MAIMGSLITAIISAPVTIDQLHNQLDRNNCQFRKDFKFSLQLKILQSKKNLSYTINFSFTTENKLFKTKMQLDVENPLWGGIEIFNHHY